MENMLVFGHNRDVLLFYSAKIGSFMKPLPQPDVVTW